MNARLQTSQLDPASFRAIADLAYRESGLILAEEKASMIRSRLRHRLQNLGMPDFAAYSAFLVSDDGKSERRHLISALTTNVSHFFREEHHFETLATEFSKRLDRLRRGGQMRLWSAGCSNGQEAISAAITLCETYRDVGSLDLRILATDIDSEVVQFASAGIYPERLLRGLSADHKAKYFTECTGDGREPFFKVQADIMKLIRFKQLNLLQDWPMSRRFDLIFCRNVVIYFDVETQMRLWPKFRQAITPDGVLFLGHSERIASPEDFNFSCTGPTTYRPLSA